MNTCRPDSSALHSYTARIDWTGNTGRGTSGYRDYLRSWDITTPGKSIVHCSNDPLIGGDPSLHNPEDLLLASVSACHMLWYLHLASRDGMVVTACTYQPEGIGEVTADGAGRFVSITLQPVITLSPGSNATLADAVHEQIHEFCFIARSLNFPVDVHATYR